MERNIGGRLGELAIRIICGPKFEGTVEAVVRDANVPRYWHVLARIDNGQLRHFIEMDSDLFISSRGLERLDVPWKRGDRIVRNVRGSGIVPFPWSRLQRNPFNL